MSDRIDLAGNTHHTAEPQLQQWVDALSAQGLRAEIHGNAQLPIASLASLEKAKPRQLAFLANLRHRERLTRCRADVIITSPVIWQSLRDEHNFTWLVTADPYLYYAKASQWWHERNRGRLVPGIHASAVVHADAEVHAGACIGPMVVIEAGACVADGAFIGAGSFIAAGAVVGADAFLHPRVTLACAVQLGTRALVHSGAVLGADGFGFARDSERHWEKIAQVGGLRIGADVEIGANTCIDRGALDDTEIGDGVKIDNLVQIGHNVRIGDHCAIAGCAGVAGSAVIGSFCTIGGSANILGHLTICDGVDISAGTWVMSSIDTPGRYSGIFPSMPHRQWERNAAALRQLAQLRQQLRRGGSNEA